MTCLNCCSGRLQHSLSAPRSHVAWRDLTPLPHDEFPVSLVSLTMMACALKHLRYSAPPRPCCCPCCCPCLLKASSRSFSSVKNCCGRCRTDLTTTVICCSIPLRQRCAAAESEPAAADYSSIIARSLLLLLLLRWPDLAITTTPELGFRKIDQELKLNVCHSEL